MSNEIDRIRQAYTQRQETVNSSDYTYAWHPRNVISFTFRQARERAMILMLNQANIRLEQAKILDIGCGYGDFLTFLISLGVFPDKTFGLDLMFPRLEKARQLCAPAIHLLQSDAQTIPFATQSFDLLTQFTVFSSILDQATQQTIAQEMNRILKPGGHLLWYDTQLHYKNNNYLQGITRSEIQQLFPHYRWQATISLHYAWLSRIARRSWFLAELLERLPGLPHSHLLLLLQKP